MSIQQQIDINRLKAAVAVLEQEVARLAKKVDAEKRGPGRPPKEDRAA